MVALADDSDQAEIARQILQRSGAESIDAAREQWWVGMRDAEQEHYAREGKDFARDEKEYRMGFQAALHAHTRRSSYEHAEGYLQNLYPDSYGTDAFRHGYERGQSYCRSVTVAPINHRSRN